MKLIVCTNSLHNLITLRLGIVKHLSAELEDLHLLTLNSRKSFRVEEIFHDNISTQKSYVRFIKNLFFFVKTEKPKLVLSYTTEANIFVCLASFIFNFKCICVYTGLGTLFNSERLVNKLILLCVVPFVRKAHMTIVLNKQDALHLIEFWKLDSKRVKVVNGSGIKIDQPINVVKTHLEEARSFVTIARLIQEKGILDLLDAIQILKTNSTFNELDVKFTIFGSYDTNNPSCLNKSELQKRCDNLNVNLVEFRKSSLPNILKTHTHFLLPSHREGTSKALLEACLSNLFPVVANVPGLNNVVEHGVSGLLFEAKDKNALSETIMEACSLSSDTTKKMADRARNKVMTGFSEEIINEEMLKILTDLDIHQ